MRHVLLLIAAAALLAAGSLRASPAGKGKKTIHVVEHADSDTVTDTGAAGDSAGDLLTFANDVFDEADATKVATDNGFCIRTVAGQAWECFWTIFLAEGQITVEGPFYDAQDSTLAVTGGTGAYRKARGWMELKAHNPQGTAFDFVYHLAG
ncbi:MAG TPA: allene oxide cyclase family protein [Candidatus Binatia bacterium]|nr:allene oxide cyclase family protein [Candidatus Binatia bacterium]